jgi:heme exporter protein B
MKTINSIVAVLQREFRITFRNFSDILSIFLFFFIGIMIFVFSVGANNDIFNQIGIGIIWTLILLTNNLTLRKFYQDDFNDGSLIIFHLSGLSYELIVLIKIIVNWFVIQIPFFILIPIAGFLLNIEIFNIKIIFISFLLGSPIITCITSISGSMNLLNKKNFAIGSLIIMILSIPVIIFSVGLVNTAEELMRDQINILLGIMFLFLAITPWICSICIKLAIQEK